MGNPLRVYLDSADVLEFVLKFLLISRCVDCGNPLTTASQLLSTNFRGRTGTAWLFSKVFNVTQGPFEDRMMTTGQHIIVDIYCNECGANLGLLSNGKTFQAGSTRTPLRSHKSIKRENSYSKRIQSNSDGQDDDDEEEQGDDSPEQEEEEGNDDDPEQEQPESSRIEETWQD
ncbi:bifunctional Yippee domain/Yippee family [Babesia duncani]|uniref:Bifunctional Yippee domain/Yippee family n=1 Tax=Babesia duncani TaxID=323732 RepID=A0AAD9PIW2_9APIC|nr:bifunctional Yippee domain/Yippee family [Babesia duncani]